METPKVELLREEKKPPKKPKFVKTKPEIKGIPNPQTKEITDLPEEFVIVDKGDLFEKEGYNRKKIMENANHDIYEIVGKVPNFY